ncbi:MAG: GNAT family N-acetyltransferase, partial [Fimbriimonadales bacterium]
ADYEALTGLLHRAYAPLAAMGFRFTATYQSVETTRFRCEGGTCVVAELDGVIVGTVTFYDAGRTEHSEWYDRPEVASFGQFGVEPSIQGNGIGRMLMDEVERLAAESGAKEIACDTAEGATHLIATYERRGYRVVGKVNWGATNYVSVILSKEIGPFSVSDP